MIANYLDFLYLYTNREPLPPNSSQSHKTGVTTLTTSVKIMKRYQISQTLPFSEFSYITESKKMFQYSELGTLHSLIPFSELASLFRSRSIHRKTEGRPSIFTTEGKIALMILKAKYNLSDRALIERLNTDIYFQIFCDLLSRLSTHYEITR